MVPEARASTPTGVLGQGSDPSSVRAGVEEQPQKTSRALEPRTSCSWKCVLQEWHPCTPAHSSALESHRHHMSLSGAIFEPSSQPVLWSGLSRLGFSNIWKRLYLWEVNLDG